MSGKINLSKMTTLAVNRTTITFGAPFVGYATAEDAYKALRRSAARISQAMADRAQMRLCDITAVGISACGKFVTMTGMVWRD
jgi:hypothetical protein